MTSSGALSRFALGALAVSLLAGCGGGSPGDLLGDAPQSSIDPVVVQDTASIARVLNEAVLKTAGEGKSSRVGTVVEQALPVVGDEVTVVANGTAGAPTIVWQRGARTTAKLPTNVAYLQITHNDASVCLRLSDDGTAAGTNSNDPTVNGPYNEYVSPQDGVVGKGWAIVGYAQAGASDEPAEGRQNGCDGVPALYYTVDGWTAGRVSTDW